jgi:hypothetical protein
VSTATARSPFNANVLPRRREVRLLVTRVEKLREDLRLTWLINNVWTIVSVPKQLER